MRSAVFARAALLLAASLALIACGGGDADDFDVSSGVLSGTVGGQPWSLAQAETNASLSDDRELWAAFYAEAADTPCSGSRTSDRHHLLVSVPRDPGRYPLGLSLSATFVIEGPSGTLEYLVATTGVIEVDAVSDTNVQGGAHIEFDSDDVVNGRFDLTVCP